MDTIIPLIQAWETYQHTHANADLRAFALWLLENETSNPSETEVTEAFAHQLNPNTLIGHLIGKLYKTLKINTKYIFNKLDLGGIDDFHFLATLQSIGTSTKKELCLHTLTEQSTGQDIIKRMVKQALIQESPHPQDKRATFVEITEKGKEKLHLAFAELQKMPEIMLGLTETEQQDLLNLLQKVEQHYKVKE
jgi:MarR family transcriptional regulator, lower aerobic nicotinate degradation pathway regulator